MSELLWFKDFTLAEEQAGQCTDKSGTGHTATLMGSATFFNFAARGKVLHFPLSTTAHVALAGTFTLGITRGLAVGAWIWREDSSPGVVIDHEGSFRLWFPDATGKPCFSVHSGGVWFDIQADTPVPTQQWIFIQGALGPIDAKIYVHGSVKGIGYPTGALGDPSTPLWIGRQAYPSGNSFYGHVGEVLIRDVALDLELHRADLKRWIRRNQGAVIELLELHLPTETLRFCSRPTFIALRTRDL